MEISTITQTTTNNEINVAPASIAGAEQDIIKVSKSITNIRSLTSWEQEDFEQIQKFAKEKKIRDSVEKLRPLPYHLNRITIVIHGVSIAANISSFFEKQELKKVSDDDKHLEYKLNRVDNTLEFYTSPTGIQCQKNFALLGSDFIKMTIDDGAVIISFDGMNDTREINVKSDVIGDIVDMKRFVEIIYTNECDTVDVKRKVLKEFIGFLEEEKLLALAKITNLSFIQELDDGLCGHDYFKSRLLGDQHSKSTLNHYTEVVVGYKAEIKEPQNFLSTDTSTLDDLQICKAIEKCIKPKFKDRRNVNVQKVGNRFVVGAKPSCRANWNKQVEIGKDHLVFTPYFADNVSYYSVETLLQEIVEIELFNSGKKTSHDYEWHVNNHDLLYATKVNKYGEDIYYENVTSTTFRTKAKVVATLHVNNINFNLENDATDITKLIANIPAQLTNEAPADATSILPLNKLEASLRYFLGQ